MTHYGYMSAILSQSVPSRFCKRYELFGLMTLGATMITKRGGTFSPKVVVNRVFPWNK